MSTKRQSEQSWPDKLYGRLPLGTEQFSIRLLKILRGQYNEPIRCKLVRSTLIGRPYDALSYTWGNPSETRSILVNGVRVLITINLELALRGLRRRDRSRTMWVDALCINQHDILERSSQVREMGDIYSSAGEVIVWLGETFEIQQLLNRESAQWLQFSQKEQDSETTTTTFESLRLNETLKEIFHRPWWTRVWVVQEVARARKDPIIALNRSHSISLSDLARLAVNNMTHMPHSLETLMSIRQRTRVPPRLRIEIIEAPDMSESRKEMSNDLHFLIHATRFFNATDPRDNIFALWTLIRGTSGHHLRPDYDMSMQQVYTAATAEVILGHGADILGLRRGRPRRYLPSWVPDFSRDPVPLPVFPIPPQLHAIQPKRSSELLPLSIDLLQNPPLMKVDAVIIDIVDSIQSIMPFHRSQGPRNPFKSLFKHLATLCSVETKSLQLDEMLGLDAVRRYQERLTQDNAGRIKDEKSKAYEALITEWSANDQRLIEIFKSSEHLELGLRQIAYECFDGFTGAEIETEQRLSDAAERLVIWSTGDSGQSGRDRTKVLRELDHSAWSSLTKLIQTYIGRLQEIDDDLHSGHLGTVIFETSQGFTGLGSKDLREGDRVALIHGFPQVAVLRPVDDQRGELDRFTFRGRTLLQIPDQDPKTRLGKLQQLWMEDRTTNMIEII